MLRDDIKILLTKQKPIYNKKLKLLKKLHLQESDKRYYINAKNYDKLNDILLSDQEIINLINVLDFKISDINDNISKIVGVSPDKIDELLDIKDNKLTKSLMSLQMQINDELSSLKIEREQLIELMKSESKNIKADIDELSNIMELKWEKNI